jgi:hypothetical protein
MVEKMPSLGFRVQPNESDVSLTDIQIRPPWTRHRIAFTAAYGALLLVAIVAMVILLNRGQYALVAISEVLILTVVVGIHTLRTRAERDWQQRWLSGPPPSEIGAIIYQASESGGVWDYSVVQSRLARMTGRLAKKGHVGQVVRLRWSKHQSRIRPINEPFEPKMLDETDSAFRELRAAYLSQVKAAEADDAEGQFAGISLWKTLRRNLIVRSGGWLGLAGFGFYFGRETVDALQRRTFRPLMAIQTLVLLLVLIDFFSTTAMSRKQWSIVPGGLMLRTARLRHATSRLHVFGRAESLLCLYQMGRRSWILCVADGDESDCAVVTTRETELLVAAWLSPVAPPSVERLADFR